MTVGLFGLAGADKRDSAVVYFLTSFWHNLTTLSCFRLATKTERDGKAEVASHTFFLKFRLSQILRDLIELKGGNTKS